MSVNEVVLEAPEGSMEVILGAILSAWFLLFAMISSEIKPEDEIDETLIGISTFIGMLAATPVSIETGKFIYKKFGSGLAAIVVFLEQFYLSLLLVGVSYAGLCGVRAFLEKHGYLRS